MASSRMPRPPGEVARTSASCVEACNFPLLATLYDGFLGSAAVIASAALFNRTSEIRRDAGLGSANFA